MFINEKEAVARVSSLDNLINKLELRKLNNGGRPKGRKNDTCDDRLSVAQTAIINGPSRAAELHDTTPSRASLLSHGIVTHALGSDDRLAPRVISKKEEVHEKALDIITSALNSLEPQIDDEKNKLKPRDLAAIAADMAKIAERTGGKINTTDNPNIPKVQVIVYAPRIRKEEEYDVIEI